MPVDVFKDTASDFWKATESYFWVSSSSSVSSSSISSSSSSISSSSISSSNSSTSSSSISSSSSMSSMSSLSSRSSISSISSVSSSSISSSSSADIWAYIWGASSVDQDETQIKWTLWKYRGAATQARNSGEYGQLLLISGDEFVSDVRDFQNTDNKYLKLSFDDKDSGSGGHVLTNCASWRGSDEYFTQDTELGPGWEDYSPGLKTWRYVQIKVMCS